MSWLDDLKAEHEDLLAKTSRLAQALSDHRSGKGKAAISLMQFVLMEIQVDAMITLGTVMASRIEDGDAANR